MSEGEEWTLSRIQNTDYLTQNTEENTEQNTEQNTEYRKEYRIRIQNKNTEYRLHCSKILEYLHCVYLSTVSVYSSIENCGRLAFLNEA